MKNVARLPDPIRSDTRPLYMQTTEALVDFLSEGGYRPGDRLPTEKEMADHLGISRATLRVALGYLETRGHIVRRPGLGTFVAAPISLQAPHGFHLALDRVEPILSVAARLDLEAKIVGREVEIVPATTEWAQKLDVPVGSELARCQIVESVEGQLGAFLEILIPAHLVDIAELKTSDLDPMECLTANDDLAPVYTQSMLSAMVATPAVAHKLQVKEGVPVLHLFETFFGRTGKSVIIAYNYFLTEVVSFYIMRRVIA